VAGGESLAKGSEPRITPRDFARYLKKRSTTKRYMRGVQLDVGKPYRFAVRRCMTGAAVGADRLSKLEIAGAICTSIYSNSSRFQMDAFLE